MSNDTRATNRRHAFRTLLGVTALGAGLGLGCENLGGGGGGRVISQDQDQTVRPDGTAVQTRTQVRETSSGTLVKETETRTREVLEPGPGVQEPDPTQRDPGAE